MNEAPEWVKAARAHWQWRGSARPDFARAPLKGQESVWDYPRPPIIVADTREVVILWGDREIARSRNTQRVLETSHPPSFYIPWADVDRAYFVAGQGGSFCEWKGPAQYWTLADGSDALPNVAWSYPRPLAGAESLSQCVAFYPRDLRCTVEGALVQAQPGGFYGGWITPELVGPFKGEPGSSGW